MNKQKQLLVGVSLALAVGAYFIYSSQPGNSQEQGLFVLEQIGRADPIDPWGKAVGDVDGDGQQDIVVGGNRSRELFFYSGRDFSKVSVASGPRYATDHEVADLNLDGHSDIVSISKGALIVYYGPNYDSQEVSPVALHDIEVVDIDNDGHLEIIGRNQSAFGGSGSRVYIFKHADDNSWSENTLDVDEGEGLDVADLNSDGFADIVVNQHWLENPGPTSSNGWSLHRYTATWEWPHAIVRTGDVDADGRIDIVAAPAEPEGSHYRISWFRSPENPTASWTEFPVRDGVETVVHSLQIADMNVDGKLDIAIAEMHQGEDPDEVLVLLNHGDGQSWTQIVIGTHGSHGLVASDFDKDGDPDLIGANWSGDDQSIYLWRNQTCDSNALGWQRLVVDEDKGQRSVFVEAADIDGDGWQDIVSGAYWYENPGFSGHQWSANPFSKVPFHAATTLDWDKDGDMDILATAARGTEPSGTLLIGRNDGSGQFDVVNAGEVDGDFLQGTTVIDRDKSIEVILSWHRTGTDVHSVTIESATGAYWTESVLGHEFAMNEGLSSADINGDGLQDIVIGTAWLAASESGYSLKYVDRPDLPPDRNRVADIDNDGLQDIIVGFEAISDVGPVVWYRNSGKYDELWDATTVAEIIGPMSLDVGDVDQDGDLDIVAGEHNLDNPQAARLLLFENRDGSGLTWKSHTIHTGDEHHDGARLADVDNDGDLDILSIGWGHGKVLVYLNKMNQCAHPQMEKS